MKPRDHYYTSPLHWQYVWKGSAMNYRAHTQST